MKSLHARFLDPVTRKRFKRFRELKRAWWSFLLLIALLVGSLAAELIANGRPLILRHRDTWFFPVFRHYTERAILGTGGDQPAQYRALVESSAFRDAPGSWVLFPLVPYGPTDIVDPSQLAVRPEIEVRIEPDPAVYGVRVDAAGQILDLTGPALPGVQDNLRGKRIQDLVDWSPDFDRALSRRFANESSDALVAPTRLPGGRAGRMEWPAFRTRSSSPGSTLIVLRETIRQDAPARTLRFDPAGACVSGDTQYFQQAPAAVKECIIALVERRRGDVAEPAFFEENGLRWRASASKEDARFPFRPSAGHPFGLDSSGRDVFARVLYGTRISLLFGIGLVLVATITGTIIGGVQGYCGGRTDLAGQRLTEIWGAMPFLYLMILAGDVFGRNIAVLFICYALFYWIGISLYMRAEFLRLRRLPFIDAARGLGLGAWPVMMRHILPNALVPVITFFPFSLVGAIGVLTALDFLGFGLPPPTPSWGELLAQAHEVKWAWWLVLYPSLALFIVMLLGVFIGEGLRAAFDPRKYARME